MEKPGAYQLRKAKPADLAFFLQVYASARSDEMRLLSWPAEEKEAFLRIQFQAQRRRYLDLYPTAQWMVIEQNDNPIGKVVIDSGARGDIILLDIVLVPEYRNRGIGSQILKGLLQKATESQRGIHLSIEPQSPAIRLFQRLGFTITQTLTDGWLEMRWSAEAKRESLV